jgi:hypothetical protein
VLLLYFCVIPRKIAVVDDVDVVEVADVVVVVVAAATCCCF